MFPAIFSPDSISARLEKENLWCHYVFLSHPEHDKKSKGLVVTGYGAGRAMLGVAETLTVMVIYGGIKESQEPEAAVVERSDVVKETQSLYVGLWIVVKELPLYDSAQYFLLTSAITIHKPIAPFSLSFTLRAIGECGWPLGSSQFQNNEESWDRPIFARQGCI
ncbi:uncharacterized protein BDR25DRAFT_359797 [Lindgomyces ingoldianus]|uniref:Uncharacterized protein n=1 Tax=Lindgomyces ingoldianus TaxID=673940 RepID=A0ACB6QHV9_9PLEO|nr:uncharacterized protein BDR25DRAFT_359797 [Lindgomyces ingoldianus]KAF2466470.1 hypothetical protein BDR25DRAFT_359797 [Lindgomyces ingoldianus]